MPDEEMPDSADLWENESNGYPGLWSPWLNAAFGNVATGAQTAVTIATVVGIAAVIIFGFVVHVRVTDRTFDPGTFTSEMSGSSCSDFSSCFKDGYQAGSDATDISSVDCGSAWITKFDTLTDAGKAACTEHGITRNRWISGFGAVLAAGALVVGSIAHERRRTAT